MSSGSHGAAFFFFLPSHPDGCFLKQSAGPSGVFLNFACSVTRRPPGCNSGWRFLCAAMICGRKLRRLLTWPFREGAAGGRSHGSSWGKGHWRREGSGEQLSGRIRLVLLTLRLIPADRRGHHQAEAGQREDGEREGGFNLCTAHD